MQVTDCILQPAPDPSNKTVSQTYLSQQIPDFEPFIPLVICPNVRGAVASQTCHVFDGFVLPLRIITFDESCKRLIPRSDGLFIIFCETVAEI